MVGSTENKAKLRLVGFVSIYMNLVSGKGLTYICFLFLLIWFNVPKISLVGSFSGTIPDNLLVQQAMLCMFTGL